MLLARAEHLSQPATPAHAGNPLSALWLRVRSELVHAAEWLQQTRCALGGHDLLLRFEPTRISLYCPSCGHNTPGWAVEGSGQRAAGRRLPATA